MGWGGSGTGTGREGGMRVGGFMSKWDLGEGGLILDRSGVMSRWD